MSVQNQNQNLSSDDEAVELAVGRRAPYTQVGDWLLLSGASVEARTLFWALSAHVSTVRDDAMVWPGLRSLARLLHLRKPDGVSRYMLELEVLGAVEVTRTTTGLRRRNVYTVHQTPPAGYTGPAALGDWYSLSRDVDVAEFDTWLDRVRAALREHCRAVAADRVAATKARRPEPATELFRVPPLSRTPSRGGTGRPADSHVSAGRAVPPPEGVRTPSRGGYVPPLEGVEQEEKEQDEISLSPARLRPVPAERSGEREKIGGRKSDHRSDQGERAGQFEPPISSARIDQQPSGSPGRPSAGSNENGADLGGDVRPADGRTTTGVDSGSREAASAVVEAYRAARGLPRLPRELVDRLHAQAVGLLDSYPAEWLCDRARELAVNGWMDLVKHAARSTAPVPGALRPAVSAGRSSTPTPPPLTRCRSCGGFHTFAADVCSPPSGPTATFAQARAALRRTSLTE